MKNLIPFIKKTILTGVIVLIPITIIVVILADTVKKLMVATAPLTEGLPIDSALIKTIIAIIFILLILGVFFFIAGLLLKTYLGNSFKNWLEEKVLIKIPMFKTLRGATQQFTGADKKKYPVVEVDLYGNNNTLLGLLTETLTDGRHLVYIPLAPIMNVGQVHIVAKENITVLDMPFKDATDIITRIGFEADSIFNPK